MLTNYCRAVDKIAGPILNFVTLDLFRFVELFWEAADVLDWTIELASRDIIAMHQNDAFLQFELTESAEYTLELSGVPQESINAYEVEYANLVAEGYAEAANAIAEILTIHLPIIGDISLESPGELRAYDSLGHVTGLVDGEEKNEIPYCWYSEGNMVFSDQVCCFEVVGKEEGIYGLKLERTVSGTNETVTFVASAIPTHSGAVHNYTIDWDMLSAGGEGAIIQIDADGDGVFEHTFASDSELIQSEYVIATDNTPPETQLNIGEPKLVVNGITYLTSATPIELIAEDELGGSGVASTAYRIRNATYSSDWIAGAQTFYLVGLSDGTYQIDYNSTDNAGNVEPTNTATVILDNTPPATSITIGAPNFVTSSSTFVTSETSFALSANDNLGSGVAASFYEIYNSTYNSGWLTCKGSFCLTKLAVGNYTIAYYSVDNVGNQESVHSVKVSLFSWTYSFNDYYGRKTTLRINIEYKLFWFAAPGKDFGIKHDLKMIVLKNAIAICYNDGTMRLEAVAIVGKINFCSAVAWDKQTNKIYLLISRLPPMWRYEQIQ
jgi:hypothetical protein